MKKVSSVEVSKCRAYAVAIGEVVVEGGQWSEVRAPRFIFTVDALVLTRKSRKEHHVYLRRNPFVNLVDLTLETVLLNGGSATREEIEALPICEKTFEELYRTAMAFNPKLGLAPSDRRTAIALAILGIGLMVVSIWFGIGG